MKPSTELFDLIKSLSKSEKRFFKLNSTLQSGEKNYLKIFDYIEGLEEYDEVKLKKTFENERFIQHLPSEKNHLYKLILKSLRLFYSDQSIGSILSQEIKNIELLYNKALYTECEKFIIRAKKIAISYEKFYYWHELLAWEKKLIEYAYEEGELHRTLDDVVAEEEDVIAKLRNLAEYQALYSRINNLFRSEGFTRNEEEKKLVETIANHHLISGKNTAISTRATTMCYYIKGLCSATNRDYTSSYLFFNKVRAILDKSNLLKDDLGKRYILTLSHLSHCYLDSGDFGNVFSTIQQMRSLSGKKGFESTDIKLQIFGVSSILELIALNTLGKFDASIKKIIEIENSIEIASEKLSKEQKISLYYEFAYTYFGLGDYKKSLLYLNTVLNDNEQLLRQDIYTYTRILNLIVHFELENFEYLAYVIKSTNRFINKSKRNYSIENYVLKQLKTLSKTKRENHYSIFKTMKNDLNKLLENPQEKVVLEFFDILAWIEAKLNDIAFAEAVKDKFRSENQALA
jgi:hypothetical protein